MIRKGKGKLYDIWLTATRNAGGKLYLRRRPVFPTAITNGIDTFTFDKKEQRDVS